MEPEFIGGEVDLRINIYRGQNDTNNARINAKKTKNGVNDIKNGIDGVKISRTKEQVQIEKLLQAIEKNPFATQAYYAEQIGVSKRTVSRIFVSLQQNGVLVQNGTNRKSNWVIINRRMQILVDADACPVIETVEKIAKEHCVPVTLLCDTNHDLIFDIGL